MELLLFKYLELHVFETLHLQVLFLLLRKDSIQFFYIWEGLIRFLLAFTCFFILNRRFHPVNRTEWRAFASQRRQSVSLSYSLVLSHLLLVAATGHFHLGQLLLELLLIMSIVKSLNDRICILLIGLLVD